MNKAYILLPLLVLGGCAQLTGDYYDDDDTYAEETGLYVEETRPIAQPQPVVQSQSQPIARLQPQTRNCRIQPPIAQPQPPVQQPQISPDGMMIELPAQQIYLGDMTGNTVVAAPAASAQMRGPAPIPGISYSAPMSGEAYQPRPQAPAVVTLQNIAYPNTYAQCTAGDKACISSYEQQGYRQVQGLPQFAGYQDVLSPSDYPQNGRWRNGNNIPRW